MARLINFLICRLRWSYCQMWCMGTFYSSSDSWRALGKIKASCHARPIGVSNFSHKHLQELFSHSDTRPVVNQIELSPFLQQPSITAFCQVEGIQLTGYCPLAKGRRLDNTILTSIAEKHGKSSAQVMIRWALQKRQAVIPKSSNPARITQNANIFDLQISADEMVQLDGLDDDYRFCPDPLSMPWKAILEEVIVEK